MSLKVAVFSYVATVWQKGKNRKLCVWRLHLLEILKTTKIPLINKQRQILIIYVRIISWYYLLTNGYSVKDKMKDSKYYWYYFCKNLINNDNDANSIEIYGSVYELCGIFLENVKIKNIVKYRKRWMWYWRCELLILTFPLIVS